MTRALVEPHFVRLAIYYETGPTFWIGIRQRELEMALAIGEHCEAIVGSVDKSTSNRGVTHAVDYSSANAAWLLVRLQALPRNLGRGNTSSGDQAREKKRLLANRRTDAGPAKSAREGGSVSWAKENHSRFYSLRLRGWIGGDPSGFHLTSFWGVASIPAGRSIFHPLKFIR
jgi:hypothetical protein